MPSRPGAEEVSAKRLRIYCRTGKAIFPAEYLLSEHGRGSVVDRQLHRVAAAPAVAPEMAGNIDCDASRLGEELTKRRPCGAEGDPAQPGIVERIGEGAAQMAGPHRLGMEDAHAGKDKAGFRVGRAERRQPRDMVDQLALCRSDRKRPVDRKSTRLNSSH